MRTFFKPVTIAIFLFCYGICCFASEKEFKSQVIFIHGWQFGKDKSVAAPEVLSQIFPGSRLRSWNWDAYDRNFEKCDDATISEAKKLSAELEKLSPEELKKTIVAGHSLGGKIAIMAMAALADKKIKIRQGIFLGSAIADNDPAIAKAVNASILPCINIYNLQDNVLRHIYAIYNLKKLKIGNIYPLGAFGYAYGCRKDQLFQIRASGSGDYISDTQKTHFVAVYLKCLRENIHLLDKIVPGEMDYSTAMDAVRIPDSLFQTPIPIPRVLRKWTNEEIIEEKKDWQVFKFHSREKVIFGKTIPEFSIWAIRDRRDRIIGWSTDISTVKTAWKNVKKQLDQL